MVQSFRGEFEANSLGACAKKWGLFLGSVFAFGRLPRRVANTEAATPAQRRCAT